MIRNDYILRMIEEFARIVSRIVALRRAESWQPAAHAIDEQCRELTGVPAAQLVELSETELLARVLTGDGAHALREKILFIVALLKEAGDVRMGEGRAAEAQACHLKALHLLLHVLAQKDLHDLPDFVPSVEMLLDPLRDSRLPMSTCVLLMQHHERTGEFARAEDALFALLEAEPAAHDLIRLGEEFYRRLLAFSDDTLRRGNLPRPEIESALEELRRRRNADAETR
jgi:hypothetical protein